MFAASKITKTYKSVNTSPAHREKFVKELLRSHTPGQTRHVLQQVAMETPLTTLGGQLLKVNQRRDYLRETGLLRIRM